jgi:hypothetical protein
MKFFLGKIVVICVALFSLFSWSSNANTLNLKNTPMSESLAFRDAENLQIGDKKVLEKMHRIAEHSEIEIKKPSKVEGKEVKRVKFTQKGKSMKRVGNSTNYAISADNLNMKFINSFLMTFLLFVL